MKYTDKQIDEFIEKVFNGDITVDNLPIDLYHAIADKLKSGLYDGYGNSLSEFKVGGIDYELLNEMRENIYMFSAAKTYQQVREMQDILKMNELLTESESFKDFKEKALEVYDTYNETWLETEYNTAISQGMAAQHWVEIEKTKQEFPYLQYSAIEDERTSDICAPLEGVTLPVDDPFWNKFTPPNHFNCRCLLLQVSKFEDVEITTEKEADELADKTDDKMQDVFKMNAGKDGYVFKDDHPYFEVDPKHKDLAKENFNLPIPKTDETD
jgi:SPP1 gp7 family putative phage head morphogenesis protein